MAQRLLGARSMTRRHTKPSRPVPSRTSLLGLALLEGALVIFIEIAGARQLAPFYGSTHVVWTAQITATLLCLAAGYSLGGRVSRPSAVGPALLGAGAWLTVSGVARARLLELTSSLGVEVGAFAAALLLYGPALMLLGSVGPNLIVGLTERRRDAGRAAGHVLFVSTFGGILGGWLTTLVLIPQASLSTSMLGAAVILAVAGMSTWARHGELPRWAWIAASGVSALIALTPRGERLLQHGNVKGELLTSQHGATGLLQVLDVPSIDGRFLLVDGTVQGAQRRSTGASLVEFSDYLLEAGLAFRPHAKSALLLGLGAGVLARNSALRGLRTTAVEIDPQVVAVAKRHFDLPDSVEIVIADARAALARGDEQFDLIVLDVYRAESFPWHLATQEAFTAMQRRLSPGGRVVINAITNATGESDGLTRLEATALSVFSEAWVFTGGPAPGQLRNATLVVGEALGPVPTQRVPGRLRAHFESARRGSRAAAPATDDFSDLDSRDRQLRLAWRGSLTPGLNPRSLVD